MPDMPRPPVPAPSVKRAPIPDRPAMAGFQPDPDADPDLVNVFDYERRAADVIASGPLAYFAGGAMDERTLRGNRAAFERRWIVPRVMTDVAEVDTSVELFGRTWPFPVFVAPTALQRMAHPDGELATARAAAARGLTMTLSSSASTDMSDIATANGPRWYQVYLLADPGARRAMVERAIGLGYEALVMTADLQRLGRRERDIRAQFRIPDGVGLPNIARAAGVPDDGAAEVDFVRTLTWDDLDWLAGFGVPVILKGVLHPDDTRRAIDHGAAAIEVSNHGGRQLDGAIPSLEALPGVLEAVDGRVPVLLDGGIRRGTDALVALAMGATAVGIGRPVLWGLAVDGEAGAGRVLDLVTGELEREMALAGVPAVRELGTLEIIER